MNVLTTIQILELRRESENIKSENENLKLERSQLINDINKYKDEFNKLSSVNNQIRIKNVELQRLNAEVDLVRKSLESMKLQYFKLQEETLSEERALDNIKKKIDAEYRTLNNITEYRKQFV